MKKGYLFILFALCLFIPFNVYAVPLAKFGDVSIKCQSNEMSLGTTQSCSIIVVNSGDTKLKIGSNNSVSGMPISNLVFNSNVIEAGNSGTVGTFDITGSAIGNHVVKIDSLQMIDPDSTAADPTASGSAAGVNTNIKVLNNVSGLTSLTVDGVSVDNFSTNKNNYIVSSSKSSVTVSGSSISGGTVTGGTGLINLNCGTNSGSITTRSEDGKSTKNYTLIINRTCNTDTSLSGITVSSGSLSPSFSSSNSNYTVNVTTDVERISITPKKNNDTQSVTSVYDRALKYGDNKFTITVTSESGEIRTYGITVVREDGRSDDANLKQIDLSDGKLTFDANITDYKFKVLYDVAKIDVTAIANNDKAKVEVTGNDPLVVGENTIIIKVTSEKETEKTYTLHVTRLNEGEDLGDDPSIKSLSVSGYDLNFKSGTYSYTLKIKNEKSLDLSIVMNQESAKYSVVGNESLKDGSTIIIKASSDDGSSLTYKINIKKDSNTWLWILIAIFVLLIIFVILLIIIKKSNKKSKNVVNEDNDDKKEETKKNVEKEETKKEVKKEVKTNVISDDELLKKIEKQISEAEHKSSDTLSNEDLKGLGEAKKESTIIKPITIIGQNDNSQKQTTRSERFASVTDDSASEVPMKKCSICGHKVPATAKVCPYCRRIWK